jgi:nicotinamide-nucleotide amidase
MTDARLLRLGEALQLRKAWLAVAESCTGGLLAARLTELPGASAWFHGGVVSYANTAKVDFLGVAPALIERFGAVSEAVARAMAEGLSARSPATWTLAVTGIAGPGGGSAEKPVGTVWIAWHSPEGTEAERFRFAGDRAAVRASSVDAALAGLARRLGVG